MDALPSPAPSPSKTSTPALLDAAPVSTGGMDEVKIYWRDKVSQLIGWSTALFLIFVGWTLDHHEKFEIGPWATNSLTGHDKRDAMVRAIGLMTFALAYAVILPLLIRQIYQKFLSHGTDATVLPFNVAMWLAVGISLLQLIVAVLISMQ